MRARPPSSFATRSGAPSNDELPAVATFTKGFMRSRGDLRTQLVEIVTSPSFRLRLVDPEPTR